MLLNAENTEKPRMISTRAPSRWRQDLSGTTPIIFDALKIKLPGMCTQIEERGSSLKSFADGYCRERRLW
jgi:hypothetical protein